MIKDATNEYKLLSGLKQKTDALPFCSCLFSLNAMSLSIAVDSCRTAKHFIFLLDRWKECLPLGDACDVNFPQWVAEIDEMTGIVKSAFFPYRIYINKSEYEPECYTRFKEQQNGQPDDNGRMDALMGIDTQDYAVVLVSALQELQRVLQEVIEYLNSPTLALISRSYEQWKAGYERQYQKSFDKTYENWKLGISPRMLKKNIQARRQEEMEKFRAMFDGDKEFELVYDAEHMTIDFEGLTRFLFTHSGRFGVSHIDGKRPVYSKELRSIFDFIELWHLMDADLQPQKKSQEKPAAPQESDKEHKVKLLVAKVQHLVVNEWKDKITPLWKMIYKEFKIEIENAGSREKFKEFSKKTLYCIMGHLKAKGVYHGVNNVEFTRLLEGDNSSMRKYINNGLSELDHSLRKRIEKMLDRELQAKAA